MSEEPIRQVIAPGIGAESGVAGSTCALCGGILDPATARSVSGHATCERCLIQLESELAEREAGVGNLPMAVVGTLIGALVGAAAWVGVAIATDMAIGYIAVLVGYLAGKGATLATGGRHGRALQQVAVGGAVIGLVLAHFALFSYYVKAYVLEEGGEVIGYLDPLITSNFVTDMTSNSSFFDLLWLFLAMSTAWRVPAGPRLDVQPS